MSFGKSYCLESDDLTTAVNVEHRLVFAYSAMQMGLHVLGASSDPCRERVDLGLALLNDGGLSLGFWYNVSLAGVLERNDVATIRHDSVLDRGLTLPRVERNDLVAVGLGGVLDWNVALGDIATLEGFNNAVPGRVAHASQHRWECVTPECLTHLDWVGISAGTLLTFA